MRNKIKLVKEVEHQLMQINKQQEKGPFDIIGDVHGCFDELKNLLEKLGYRIKKGNKYIITHPQERRIIFVGVSNGSKMIQSNG